METEAARQEKPLIAIPDFLTGIRIPLAVAFLVLPQIAARLTILVLFVVTDVLDGWVARKFGGSRIGKVLDPVCDKLFMLAGFWTVYNSGVLNLPEMLAVLFRDIVAAVGLIVVFVLGRTTTLPSRAGGRAVTVAQILTLISFVAGSDLTGSLAWATGAISLYAIWDYSRAFSQRKIGADR
jgi:CDP-diacylglycerol---glycerol-3-phosphate 3-phosphatidyltransferase